MSLNPRDRVVGSGSTCCRAISRPAGMLISGTGGRGQTGERTAVVAVKGW